MELLTYYHIALVMHIIGLAMMAGTTLADYVITKQFWKQYATDKSKGIAINQAMSKFVLLFGIGILLLIISGISMMAITRGAFGEQLWFRIKFALVIIVILNGVVVGRRQGIKLRNLLPQAIAGENIDSRLLTVRSNINWFQLSQMALFIIIFVLSAFKFN